MEISEFKDVLTTKVLNNIHFLEMDFMSYIERRDLSYSNRIDLCIECLKEIRKNEDLLITINNKFSKLFKGDCNND